MSTLPYETIVPAAVPETIGALERLDVLRRQAGFLATTRGELNEAFGLLAFEDSPGGAAQHLAEIGRHQAAHDADPVRAQLSVTREYAGYAQRSRTDRTMLGTLAEELRDSTPKHPFSVLDPAAVHTGKGQLVRFVDLGRLAAHKNPQQFPFMPLRGYGKGERDAADPYIAEHPKPVVAQHIAVVLGRIRAGKAPAVVGSAIEDQQNRFGFWTARLQEIESHQTGAVRAAARRSLQGLGVRGR
jgi:hypothetical protein